MSTTPIGRPFTDGGIQFQLVQEVTSGIYPTPHMRVEFILQPTPAGRRSAAYREERRELGDDWVRTVSDPLVIGEVFMRAGLTMDETVRILDEAHQMRMAGYAR